MAAKKLVTPTRRHHGALDQPLPSRSRRMWRSSPPNPDAFGQWTEGIARFMGTPQFLLWMTLFCMLWLGWNTVAPEPWRFDSAALGFTALTLMLSLQASYAAPLLLLAQNRQDDRDRVSLREDRKRSERNLADTEYLTREISGLRLALQEVATRDFVRSELRGTLEDLVQELSENLRTEMVAELRRPASEAVTDPEGSMTRRDAERREDPDPATTTLAVLSEEDAAQHHNPQEH